MLGHRVVNSVHGTASLPWGGVSALSSYMQTGLAPPDISIFVPAAVAHLSLILTPIVFITEGEES